MKSLRESRLAESPSLPDTIIPPGAVLDRVVEAYGPLGDAVVCGLSGCRTRHNKGFVVAFRDQDGRKGEGIVGHVCGRKYFGQGWLQAQQDYDNRVRTSDLRARAESFLAVAEQVLPRLRELLPEAKRHHALHHRLCAAVPRLMRTCADVFKSRSDRLQGVLIEGHRFFVQDRAYECCRDLKLDIEGVLGLIDAKGTTVAQLGFRITRAGDVRRRFRDIEVEVEDARKALTPAHMRRLIRLLEDRNFPLGIRMSGTVLQRDRSYLENYRIVRQWERLADLGDTSEAVEMPGPVPYETYTA